MFFKCYMQQKQNIIINKTFRLQLRYFVHLDFFFRITSDAILAFQDSSCNVWSNDSFHSPHCVKVRYWLVNYHVSYRFPLLFPSGWSSRGRWDPISLDYRKFVYKMAQWILPNNFFSDCGSYCFQIRLHSMSSHSWFDFFLTKLFFFSFLEIHRLLAQSGKSHSLVISIFEIIIISFGKPWAKGFPENR